MNKNDLCVKVYERVGEELKLSKGEVSSVVSALFDVVTDTVLAKEDVTIQNFGKWSVVTKKARKGRNPKTGDELMIPERQSVKFAVSSKIKGELNA